MLLEVLALLIEWFVAAIRADLEVADKLTGVFVVDGHTSTIGFGLPRFDVRFEEVADWLTLLIGNRYTPGLFGRWGRRRACCWSRAARLTRSRCND